jgi:hypothetical protein
MATDNRSAIDALADSRMTVRLTERAESYARDARRFADAGILGTPIISAKDDAYWARVYRVVADELRQVCA